MLTNISDFLFTKAYAQTKSNLDFFNLFSFKDQKVSDPNKFFSSTLNNILTWVLAIIFLIAFIAISFLIWWPTLKPCARRARPGS